jgi:hypothetical protein
MVHTNDTFFLDKTLYNGRPNDITGRLPKEIRTYDLLDKFNISYQRVDHSPLPTIDACQEVDALLNIEICKNLFLRNAQKTDFYLLLLPGGKNSVLPLFPSKSAHPDSLLQNRISWSNSWTSPLDLFRFLGL